MKRLLLNKILDILAIETKNLPRTLVESVILEFGHDPFFVYLCGVIGMRARDIAVLPVVRKILGYGKTPQELILLDDNIICDLFYPLGFYNRRFFLFKRSLEDILEIYNGKIPESKEKLYKIFGVGEKVASLILSEGFFKQEICVDTHVFRLSHEFGLSCGKTPLAVKKDLNNICDESRKRLINKYFVLYGQNLCKSNSRECIHCLKKSLCIELRSLQYTI